jgi:hypothetical protein
LCFGCLNRLYRHWGFFHNSFVTPFVGLFNMLLLHRRVVPNIVRVI